MIKDFDLGQFLHFKKNPHYHGEKLPVNVGKWNFDDVKIMYFKNDRFLSEAFKKGLFEIPKQTAQVAKWMNLYGMPMQVKAVHYVQ